MPPNGGERPAHAAAGGKAPAGGPGTRGRRRERSVMMEASPGSPFEVIQAELALHLLIVAFDAPSEFGEPRQRAHGVLDGRTTDRTSRASRLRVATRRGAIPRDRGPRPRNVGVRVGRARLQSARVGVRVILLAMSLGGAAMWRQVRASVTAVFFAQAPRGFAGSLWPFDAWERRRGSPVATRRGLLGHGGDTTAPLGECFAEVCDITERRIAEHDCLRTSAYRASSRSENRSATWART